MLRRLNKAGRVNIRAEKEAGSLFITKNKSEDYSTRTGHTP